MHFSSDYLCTFFLGLFSDLWRRVNLSWKDRGDERAYGLRRVWEEDKESNPKNGRYVIELSCPTKYTVLYYYCARSLIWMLVDRFQESMTWRSTWRGRRWRWTGTWSRRRCSRRCGGRGGVPCCGRTRTPAAASSRAAPCTFSRSSRTTTSTTPARGCRRTRRARRPRTTTTSMATTTRASTAATTTMAPTPPSSAPGPRITSATRTRRAALSCDWNHRSHMRGANLLLCLWHMTVSQKAKILFVQFPNLDKKKGSSPQSKLGQCHNAQWQKQFGRCIGMNPLAIIPFSTPLHDQLKQDAVQWDTTCV